MCPWPLRVGGPGRWSAVIGWLVLRIGEVVGICVRWLKNITVAERDNVMLLDVVPGVSVCLYCVRV